MIDTNDDDEQEKQEVEKIEVDCGGDGVEVEHITEADDNIISPPVVIASGDGDNAGEDGACGDGTSADSNSDDIDLENLDDLLENLDIDNDFECWESMKGKQNGQEESGESNDNHVGAAPPADEAKAKANDNVGTHDNARPSSPNTLVQQELQKWKDRLEREEVYSRLYRPSGAERAELKELETYLNMQPKRGLRTLFTRATSGSGRNITEADRSAWNLLIHPEEQHQQADAANAAAHHPFPSSILLKRGPVQYGYDDSNGNEQVEGEAILLTRGFILAKAEKNTSKKSVVSTTHSLDRVILWQNVTFVEPVAGDDMSWTLTIQIPQQQKDDDSSNNNGATTTTPPPPVDGTVSDGSGEHSASANNSEHHDNDSNNNNIAQQQHLTIVCDSLEQRDAWLDAMERVLIPHHLHNTNNQGNNAIAITELGWQYKLVHRPAFTMAVTGMVADMFLPPPEVLNQLDRYNEYTPLHYAVRLDMTTSIRRLLDAGADPNVKDADGRTCMYYAVRDELPNTTINLLKEYGAKESKLAKLETKGELFGRVQATEQVRQERREVQQHQEAVEAQVKMNENLRLLNERGEKIEELGNKASDLNENAANFATMAKQLKEKSKKQSKWLPFL